MWVYQLINIILRKDDTERKLRAKMKKIENKNSQLAKVDNIPYLGMCINKH